MHQFVTVPQLLGLPANTHVDSRASVCQNWSDRTHEEVLSANVTSDR
jgi:hypothetical protein